MRERKRQRIPSPQQLRVLEWLLNEDASHGYDMMKAVGLGPGTLYGLLKRLYDEAYLDKTSEVVDGRNRISYTLTARGRAYAERALLEAEYETAIRNPANLEIP